MKDKNIINRLNRAEGQIKAVKKMYEEGSECLDMTQQIAAARSALNKVAVKLLEQELKTCYQDSSQEKFSKVLESITKLSK